MQILWEKRGDWWIKTRIKDDGIPIHTYHYKRKAASPFPTIKIQTNLSRRLSGYLLIKKDLKDIICLLVEPQ